MNEIESRLATLEKRLLEAEDRLAIYQVLASFGPGADSNSRDALSGLWLTDGTYETEQYVFRGAAEVGALVDTKMHQDFVGRGSAHVLSLPHVVLQGNQATATNYSRVYVHDDGQWRVARASANCWYLDRTTAGWKVRRRINRTLSGGEEARALIGGAFRV